MESSRTPSKPVDAENERNQAFKRMSKKNMNMETITLPLRLLKTLPLCPRLNEPEEKCPFARPLPFFPPEQMIFEVYFFRVSAVRSSFWRGGGVCVSQKRTQKHFKKETLCNLVAATFGMCLRILFDESDRIQLSKYYPNLHHLFDSKMRSSGYDVQKIPGYRKRKLLLKGKTSN